MLTTAVIDKQRLLNEQEIVQLIHNYKCYGVEQSHFRKPLKRSTINLKKSYRKTTRLFLIMVSFSL